MPDAIIIESLCRRPKGQNLIDMGDGTIYDFRDDGTGAQVALVSNPAHQRKLLSITEGFAFKGAPGAQPVVASALSLPALEAAFDAIVPASVTEAGPVPPKPPATFAEAEALMAQFGAPDPKSAAYAAFPHLVENLPPTAPPEPAPATLQKPVTPPADPSEASDLAVSEHADLNGKGLAEIRAIFKDEMNKNPSPRHKIEMLVAQIEAVRAERAKGPAN